MNAPGLPAAPLPRWLPWLFVGLLVLPFHPLWIDFEQVRRGLLLVLAGACLLLLPGLPRCRGGRAALWFLAVLCASGITNGSWQWLSASERTPVSFQVWEAGYRLAHWLALGVMLRLGAAAPAAFGTPIIVMLLATSAFGLLQRLGVATIGAYGLPHEPVSTLGNLNVASEWTAVAACAVAACSPAALGGGRPWWRAAALAAATAWLVVNGSRSGLVALPLGLLLLLWLQRAGARPWLAVAACAGGALGGLLIEATVARSAAAPPTNAQQPADAEQPTNAQQPAEQRGLDTLEVRHEISKSCLELLVEAPLFGHGPGQFQVQYPRVRSQFEIEKSSHGRKFAVEVRTAHNDWLELLVDGGLPALLLFVWALLSLGRGHEDRARLVPLFVLALLMFVRSPLWNAPAVVAAALLAGTAHPVAVARSSAARSLAARSCRAMLGAAMLLLGLLPLVGNTLVVWYMNNRAAGEPPPLTAQERESRRESQLAPLKCAESWMPFEPRWKQLLAQEQMADGKLDDAATTAARAIKLRPFDPQLYVLLGEILARASQYAAAEGLARHALAFDAHNPELHVLLSTVLAQRGAIDEAIKVVVEAPHETLRARLAAHFAGLAALAARAGDEVSAARFRVEQAFVLAVDGLGDRSPGGRAATNVLVTELLQALSAAGMQKRDLRGYVIGALHALDLGKTAMAAELGTTAVALGVPFPQWQRDLLGEALGPLQHVPSWQPVLRR